jgi:hypothetical protein
MTTIADTLVLKMEEHDSVHGLDTTLYFLYDNALQTYIIRGKRRSCSKREFNPYSLECKNVKDLVNFIEFSVETTNQFSYTLYNNIDLPINSSEITYDSLAQHDNKSDEIVGYDNSYFNKMNLIKSLRILQNVCNYY